MLSQRYSFYVILSVIFSFTVIPVFAQAFLQSEAVQIRGSMGSYNEVYDIHGKTARRPANTRRLFVRPVMTSGDWIIPVDFLISSEETPERQPFNRYGISPQWKWVTLHAGDFYPQFSKLMLSGITIRGGGLELRPGIFRFSVIAGQSRRAVERTASLGLESYQRNVWAVKLGLGKEDGSFFDLNLIRSVDDTNSVQDSISVTPQENIVVGVNGQTLFFDKRFYIRWDGAGSVHTRDLYSSVIEDESIPESVTEYFVPRLSTKADYSYQIDTGFRIRRGNVHVSYGRLGPGYMSLCTATTINDRKKLNIRSQIKILKNKLDFRARYTRYNDNLQNQKKATTTRLSQSMTLNIRPLQSMFFNLGYSRNTSGNNARYDTLRVETYNGRYGVDSQIQFKLLQRSQTLQLGYNIQESERKNPLRANSGFDVRNYKAGLRSQIVSGLSLNPVASLTRNAMADGTIRNTYQYSLAVQHNGFDRKLQNRLSLSWRGTGENLSLSYGISIRYRLSRSDQLILDIRRTDYSNEIDSYRNFQETVGSFRIAHRF